MGITLLDERINNISATVKQIEENIAELNRQIENQGSAVEESTASVNEMVSTFSSGHKAKAPFELSNGATIKEPSNRSTLKASRSMV
jgi:methyl-accepting chemotaxis protein